MIGLFRGYDTIDGLRSVLEGITLDTDLEKLDKQHINLPNGQKLLVRVFPTGDHMLQYKVCRRDEQVKSETKGVFLAAASRGWAGWTPPPPPWLATAGQKWLGGKLAKIKENEEKTATLGVPRGASQPLLTCGYMCYCIWGY